MREAASKVASLERVRELARRQKDFRETLKREKEPDAQGDSGVYVLESVQISHGSVGQFEHQMVDDAVGAIVPR